MAGLSPSPPKLQMENGLYEVEIKDYEYPMPEEVSSIQGDYEEDVVFSVYIALPKDHDGMMPLQLYCTVSPTHSLNHMLIGLKL